MNVTHFGPTKAGQDLVKLIQGNAKLQRRVCRLYAEYMEGLKQIAAIPQATLRRRLLTLWHEDTCTRGCRLGPPEVQTFLCNVLRAAYRAILRREKPDAVFHNGKFDVTLLDK